MARGQVDRFESQGELKPVGPAIPTMLGTNSQDVRPEYAGSKANAGEGRARKQREEKMPTSKMIVGAHSIIYSKKPEADRAFLRDVFGLPHVDVGEGWLIFGLPPAELAIHPSSRNNRHEFYFMCADTRAFVAAMKKKHVTCSPIQVLSWGRLTHLTLPGGGKLGVYQPLHARPNPHRRGTPETSGRSKRKAH